MSGALDGATLKEVAEGRMTLTCRTHNYTGQGGPPTSGCPKCIMALFVGWMSKVPATEFAEEVQKFNRVVRLMCEEEDRGLLDYQPFANPQIEYGKDF